ncbi:MAG TPA: hypothetical protein PLD48_02760 [Bacillota bacterium]|nr:hypothetical protein [Bacillota bacterium]HOK69069.1 hypothetical protein [Bacillota bacterium]HPP85096.1 hypothetical protein [Bacillota bacterium]
MRKQNCQWELTTTVGAAAAAIARNLTDEQLALLSAVLVSLGDNLALILAQRECGENRDVNRSGTPLRPLA